MKQGEFVVLSPLFPIEVAVNLGASPPFANNSILLNSSGLEKNKYSPASSAPILTTIFQWVAIIRPDYISCLYLPLHSTQYPNNGWFNSLFFSLKSRYGRLNSRIIRSFLAEQSYPAKMLVALKSNEKNTYGVCLKCFFSGKRPQTVL